MEFLTDRTDHVNDSLKLVHPYLHNHKVGVRNEHSLQNGDIGELSGVDGVFIVGKCIHRAFSRIVGFGCNHIARDRSDERVAIGVFVGDPASLNDVQIIVFGTNEKVPATSKPDSVDFTNNTCVLKGIGVLLIGGNVDNQLLAHNRRMLGKSQAIMPIRGALSQPVGQVLQGFLSVDHRNLPFCFSVWRVVHILYYIFNKESNYVKYK